jgi:hypothetical protein
MTEQEIIELAIQAEFVNLDLCSSELMRFAKLVAKKEREACAKLFEQGDEMGEWYSYEAAKEIRARGSV